MRLHIYSMNNWTPEKPSVFASDTVEVDCNCLDELRDTALMDALYSVGVSKEYDLRLVGRHALDAIFTTPGMTYFYFIKVDVR